MTPTWLVGMQQMPQLRDLSMDRVVVPRRQALRAVLEQGQQRGEIRDDIDLESAVTCLSAPAILIGMHPGRGAPTSPVDVGGTVDLVLGGLLRPARATGS
jgi:hypothetical protein